jgi:rhodanese-related sulfurtransferase
MLDNVQGLTVVEVLHLIEEGVRPKFIDARDPLAWEASAARIPGAIHVPLEAADEYVAALPRDRRLIAYGTMHDDRRAADLARVLAYRGFAASYLHGGFAAWVAAGLPVGRR